MTDLSSKIQSWLKKQGYPLEMEVARAMRKAGFGTVQSEYLEDIDSGKLRETDIIGFEQVSGDNCSIITATTIECKSSADKPWVLFTSMDGYPSSLGITRKATSDKGNQILRILANDTHIQTLLPFAIPQRTAHNVTVALRDHNNDLAYSALDSVAKASVGIVNRLSNLESKRIIPFAFPILLIDAPLFEAFLGPDGDLVVEPTTMGFLAWKNPIIANHSLIHIYQKERFLAELELYRDHMVEFCETAKGTFEKFQSTAS